MVSAGAMVGAIVGAAAAAGAVFTGGAAIGGIIAAVGVSALTGSISGKTALIDAMYMCMPDKAQQMDKCKEQRAHSKSNGTDA